MRRGILVVKSSENYSVMNRDMLRFRPIAPKPPGRDNIFEAADLAKRNGSVKRTKRKYARVRCRQTKQKNVQKQDSHNTNTHVTLQLLPERSESEQICSLENNNNFELTEPKTVEGGGLMELKKNFRSVVETWIIVERVTDHSYGSVGLGFTDKDRVTNLEADTCPGFVSDATNKVVWVNEAYRRMVMVEEGNSNGVYVSLIVNEKLPYYCPSFACRVRLIEHSKNGEKWNKILPCDVWRMNFQGFAWKLDFNTALSL